MKKLLFVLIGLLVMIPIFAQNPNPSIWEVISNLGTYLGSPEAFAIAVPIVAAIITGLLKLEENWPKRLVSWGVAIAGLVVADIANFGFVALYPIWEAAVVGLFIGLAANGIFTVPQIKPFIDKIHELAASIGVKKI
jgi:ribose/xylose/arabinose/galactoside ABC-type transport system permease subunit